MAQPAPVGIELPPRDEPGPDPAGHGAELAAADQLAHVLFGAPKLGGQLAHGQVGRLLDRRSIAAFEFGRLY
jgi:hypothetical protein